MIATIDIGTNSTRLLIAETAHTESGMQIMPAVRQLKITRLGQGVNASGHLRPEALERTYQALAEYQELLSHYPIERLIVTATSAVRHAANQAEFLKGVKERTGWAVRVLSGQEEAWASFVGAWKAVQDAGVFLGDELLVIDIGGGSTEIVCGRSNGEVLFSGSCQVGAVRMTEMDNQELGSLQKTVRERTAALIRQLPVDVSGNLTVIGVGGTITTLAALELELVDYDPDKITGFCLTKERIEAWFEKLARMKLHEREVLPGLNPGRADVIPAGAGICAVLMDLLGAERILVSDGDLMQGVWHIF